MRAIIHSLTRATWEFCVLTLAILLPVLVQAQPEDNAQPVKALTTSSSDALLVLRDSGLFAVDDGTPTQIALPAASQGSKPTSLARGADGSVYLAGPALSERLTDREIGAVIKYLKILWTDEQRQYQLTESQ